MRLTQEQVIEEIKKRKLLKDFPEWQDNKEVVLEAVKRNGMNLQFASERLKDDKGVVLEAIEKYGYSLMYASDRLRGDKGVVLGAIKRDGLNLQFASKKLKDDKGVVLEAVKQDGWCLQFASDRLRDDKEVVLGAVKQNGWTLVFVSDRLKDDKEVVLEGLNKDSWVLRHASDRLKKELLLQALSSFRYKKYKGDFDVIELVKHDGMFLSLLITEDRNNKEVVLEAIKQNKFSLAYASTKIRNRIGSNNPVEFLERWIKSEELEQRLNKKGKSGKIKL